MVSIHVEHVRRQDLVGLKFPAVELPKLQVYHDTLSAQPTLSSNAQPSTSTTREPHLLETNDGIRFPAPRDAATAILHLRNRPKHLSTPTYIRLSPLLHTPTKPHNPLLAALLLELPHTNLLSTSPPLQPNRRRCAFHPALLQRADIAEAFFARRESCHTVDDHI